MFCSVSLEEDPYDLIEWDDGELVCGEMLRKQGRGLATNLYAIHASPKITQSILRHSDISSVTMQL